MRSALAYPPRWDQFVKYNLQKFIGRLHNKSKINELAQTEGSPMNL